MTPPHTTWHYGGPPQTNFANRHSCSAHRSSLQFLNKFPFHDESPPSFVRRPSDATVPGRMTPAAGRSSRLPQAPSTRGHVRTSTGYSNPVVASFYNCMQGKHTKFCFSPSAGVLPSVLLVFVYCILEHSHTPEEAPKKQRARTYDP